MATVPRYSPSGNRFHCVLVRFWLPSYCLICAPCCDVFSSLWSSWSACLDAFSAGLKRSLRSSKVRVSYICNFGFSISQPKLVVARAPKLIQNLNLFEGMRSHVGWGGGGD